MGNKKYVIFYSHTDGSWYFTSKQNYYSYVQNPRSIHKVEESNPVDFVSKMCDWYNDSPENYEIIYQ